MENQISAASDRKVVMKAKKQFKKVVRIYCDGDTEKKYLQAMFAERYKGIKATILPQIKNSIEDIMDAVLEELKDPETKDLKGLFLVLDMDTLYIQKKLTAYKRMKREIKKLVIVTTPSLNHALV